MAQVRSDEQQTRRVNQTYTDKQYHDDGYPDSSALLQSASSLVLSHQDTIGKAKLKVLP
jgi:hypothetical protein